MIKAINPAKISFLNPNHPTVNPVEIKAATRAAMM
jgi:hypothetical protein